MKPLSVKVKYPDPGVALHDQKPDRGIVSGIKSPPLARTPPHGIYIDRCIIWESQRRENSYRVNGQKAKKWLQLSH